MLGSLGSCPCGGHLKDPPVHTSCAETTDLPGTGWWQSHTLSSCPGRLFSGLSSGYKRGPGLG